MRGRAIYSTHCRHSNNGDDSQCHDPLNISYNYQLMVRGIILVAAVTLELRARRRPINNKVLRLLLRYKSVFLLILMIAVAVQMSGKFATVRNATNILQQIAPNGIVAVGLTLVSITGGLDMSTGSVMALTGVITMMQLKSGSSLPIAILSGSMVGVLTGFVNGVFVGKVKISPFIMTLATQTLVRGIALGITDTYPVSLWHPGLLSCPWVK